VPTLADCLLMLILHSILLTLTELLGRQPRVPQIENVQLLLITCRMRPLAIDYGAASLRENIMSLKNTCLQIIHAVNAKLSLCLIN
jgi:hypothetical protein